MLLTVREFIETTRTAMPALVDQLQEETGRFGEEEGAAWQGSLGAVATMFEQADLGEMERRWQLAKERGRMA